MKFTFSWLKQHLEINASVEEIAQALTLIGFEIESIIDNSAIYNPFIIAQIEEAIQHPNAEKLRVCKVTDGKRILQIVCGAENARTGIKVVLAPIGTKIPSSNLEIKPVKIRGIESNGMLCSSDELNLSNYNEGIIELEHDAIVGNKFAEYASLNDVVFEIAVTPNRGDALSVFGIARELAAKGIGKLKPLPQFNIKTTNQNLPLVTIAEKDNCQEFIIRRINNVNNNQKQLAFSNLLKSIDFSSISPLVDISNYAMSDYGRPNHIYDADKIKGNITVRLSKNGEKFIALGGEEYTLPEEVLVIADDEKVLGIAGIIGGELSKVNENTKNILIEIANFNPETIVKAGRILNIHTDARFRFERRVDFETGKFFMEYITSLILENCEGQASQIYIANGNKLNYKTSIKFSIDTIKRITGINIDRPQIEMILTNLGFELDGDNIHIPSYRQGDIDGEEDIVEEIIRVYGYENVPCSPITTSTINTIINKESSLDKCRKVLIDRKLTELISWSFSDDKASKHFSFKNVLRLKNPINAELSLMRMSVLPNHLIIAARNMAYGNNNLGFFETGLIYTNEYNDKQTSCVSGIRTGKYNPRSLYKDEREYDFYDAKADVFSVINCFGYNTSKLVLSNEVPKYYHPGKSASILIGKTIIAYCGEIHPEVIKAYDIKENVIAFEVFTNNIPKPKNKIQQGAFEVSNYQSVVRDFAFIIDVNQTVGEVTRALKNIHPGLIEDINVFDVYKGKEIGTDKKSIAITVKLQPTDRTLSEAEISKISEEITTTVSTKFNATLRG